MKKFSFLALAAAGMLLAACSSDKEVAEGPGVVTTGTEGYIGISIQLPNASTPTLPTRSNDDYNDGDATEYAVKSGRLFLFKGATEADAQFVMASEIIEPTTGWNTDGSTYVTSTKTAVAKIQNITFTSSENLYAYVALNYVGTALAVNPAAGTTFGTWSKTTLAAAQTGGSLEGEISDNGLLMTNAPIASAQGGSKDPSLTPAIVTTAAVLDKTAIKNTKADAEEQPAGCVFVERAAAKVTLEVTATATSIDMGGDDLALDVSTLKWQIINTEANFYNARQANEPKWLPYFNPAATNANSKWRFVSNNLFSPQIPQGVTHEDGYRTYFAMDPTYTTDHDALDKPVAIDDNDHWLSTYAEEKMKRAYVPENTFPTIYQTRKNTTQATIKVQFNGGADFYTISRDAKYYDETNAKNKLASNLLADYNVDLYMDQAADNIATVAGEPVTGTLVIDFTSTDAGTVTYTATPKFTATATEYGVDDITDATLKTSLTDAIAAAIGDNVLTLYDKGWSYYNVRIKHFGEVETPWAADGAYVSQPGETTEQIYKLSDPAWGDNAFLGRYGIVRDNWYKLSIDGITKLGSATPPDVTGDPTPDDEIEKEYYISAHVHILPWVIRNQSVSF